MNADENGETAKSAAAVWFPGFIVIKDPVSEQSMVKKIKKKISNLKKKF